MRNWGHSKRLCFLRNNKAQSLTELATFGSMLLLVVSFLIRYGMSYIHQQDMNMRAFRLALADAAPATSSSSSLIVVKDRHIPDPQDQFGVGSVVPVQGSADISWSNGDTGSSSSTSIDYPKMKFIINEDAKSQNQPFVKEYTTAGDGEVTSANSPGGFYILLAGSANRTLISWQNVRATAGPDGLLAKVLLPNLQTEVITDVAVSATTPLQRIVEFFPSDLQAGDLITGFKVVDPSAGQINTAYFALNADLDYNGTPDVNQDNLQGLLPSEITMNRNDALHLEEQPGTGGYYKSTDTLSSNAQVTHKIKLNNGSIDTTTQTYDLNMSGMGKVWQTTK